MKFAKKRGSAPEAELGKDFYFDSEDDLLHSKKEIGNPLAIELEGKAGPKTKKNDVETSDDNKDRRMWM